MTNTAAPAPAPAVAPLVGAALLAHRHAARLANWGTAQIASTAGYVTAGRVNFTAFYEACLEAAEAQDNPQGFRPWRERNRRPMALLTLTVDGEPLPFPSFAMEAGSDNETAADEWNGALAWLREWRQEIAQAAEGFPPGAIEATLTDRHGSHRFATINSYTQGVALTNLWIECDHCSDVEWADDAHEVGDETWCDECHGSHSVRCDGCGEYFAAGDLTTVAGGNEICSGCLDDYQRCPECNELQPSDGFRALYTHGGQHVGHACAECVENNLASGAWCIDEDGDIVRDQERSECGGMEFHSYHTEPHTTLKTEPLDTGRAYGVEMEFNGRPSSDTALAKACDGFAILTEDGTVSGELVTVAAGAGEINQWLRRTCEALEGTRNTDGAGMHIHCDRRHLQPWQWFRLAHYCRTHKTTLETVGGRGETHYQGWDRLASRSWAGFAQIWKGRTQASTRYLGLRVTSKTVEFRCCRATKNTTRALARFALIRRLIALGKIPDSLKPRSEYDLKGYLAQDPYIQKVTGWEPGEYNYRQAINSAPELGDLAPWQQAESTEKAALLRIRLEVQRRLLEYLQRQELAAEDQRWNVRISRARRAMYRLERRNWEEQTWVERDRMRQIETELANLMPLVR
jgi:hypothetical protein